MRAQSDRRSARRWILVVLVVEAVVVLATIFTPVPAAVLLAGPLVAVSGWAGTAARSQSRTKRSLAETTASLARMTHIADVTQRAIVRPLPSELGGITLAVHTRSATHGALIGGDLHDAVATRTGTRLLLADVKGHGIDAVPLAASVLSAFRHNAAAEHDLSRLARIIDAHIAPELGPEDFVTLLLADVVDGEVHLVNCGHPPPLRIGRHRVMHLEPPAPSPPLGLAPEPRLHRVRLTTAHRLLFYTDGLTEARDPRGEALALDTIAEPVRTAPDLDQALDKILDLIRSRAVNDDLTLLLAQPTPAPVPAPAPRAEVRGPRR
ncbi:PP2C family protein-serine/threonine phosphatase [Spirillospora sp. NPDC047279]|uniref:PP2C family protein-serine/threonine phosphatase n=1 Tax=Spirillospora sp. NPDC047279 TaxID=3155478 RepID=UPI003408C222